MRRYRYIVETKDHTKLCGWNFFSRTNDESEARSILSGAKISGKEARIVRINPASGAIEKPIYADNVIQDNNLDEC